MPTYQGFGGKCKNYIMGLQSQLYVSIPIVLVSKYKQILINQISVFAIDGTNQR